MTTAAIRKSTPRPLTPAAPAGHALPGTALTPPAADRQHPRAPLGLAAGHLGATGRQADQDQLKHPDLGTIANADSGMSGRVCGRGREHLLGRAGQAVAFVESVFESSKEE